MSLLYQKHASRPLTLDNRVEPELYRDVFPYTHVSRIEFDDTFLVPRPADPMFITDTTFRDGQQARPPYTVKQIARIYDLLHKLGGKSGLIQASEFFMYSPQGSQGHRSLPRQRLPFPPRHRLDPRQHGRPQDRP